MTNVVINLCGVRSKGGITVVNNYLAQNSTKNLYVLFDNLELKKYIEDLLMIYEMNEVILVLPGKPLYAPNRNENIIITTLF